MLSASSPCSSGSGGWAVFLCRFIPILRASDIRPEVGSCRDAGQEVHAVERPRRRRLASGVIVLSGYYVGEKLHIDRYVLPVVAGVVVLSVLLGSSVRV